MNRDPTREENEYMARQLAVILLDRRSYEEIPDEHETVNTHLQEIFNNNMATIERKIGRAKIYIMESGLHPYVKTKLIRVLSRERYNKLVNWARHTQ